MSAVTRIRNARADLEHYLESVLGMEVAHSRRQRNGEIRVYLLSKWSTAGVSSRTGNQWDGVTEVHWDPRRPFVVSTYFPIWVDTGRGNLGGHEEMERYSDEQLADYLISTLSETV